MKNRFKYPRTPHLPVSPGATNDDKMLANVDHFLGKDVVITMKMDGENTTMYNDGMHARSIDSRAHPSRDWVKAFHASICHEIPDGWRICGENLYARHSIEYENLPSYFMGFSVWDDSNTALTWESTVEVFTMLGIQSVPVLYEGVFNESVITQLIKNFDTEKNEGFVIRLAGSFHYTEFEQSVAKWVRENHVQTDTHWTHSKVVPNKLHV